MENNVNWREKLVVLARSRFNFYVISNFCIIDMRHQITASYNLGLLEASDREKNILFCIRIKSALNIFIVTYLF